jgi:cell wall-associated NlpC family hydrolase
MIQTLQICTNHSEFIMITAINLLSVIPMRKEPSHRSEMVSQLLFGEYAEIMEEEEHFVRIRCLYDDYEGWVQANQLNGVNEVLFTETYIGNWTEKILVNGEYRNIPLCSPVYGSAPDAVQFNGAEVVYPSSKDSLWSHLQEAITPSSLKKIYSKFLHTPYLWGGKSVFGIDCSGFVQQVFKLFGVKLLRDAYLQAEQGKAVESLMETREGDLAFFCNENGRVTHVGIILNSNQIVHASGKVRIDTLDEKGIITDTGKRTHQLHSTRRYF